MVLAGDLVSQETFSFANRLRSEISLNHQQTESGDNLNELSIGRPTPFEDDRSVPGLRLRNAQHPSSEEEHRLSLMGD